MLISNIRWQNLLSYGNYWTDVDFLKDGLTVIVGSNGVGKSTLLDALCFVLFGRAFRNINKPLLVNSITKKGLEVEIEFSTSAGWYKVRRGIKPALFEIWHMSLTNGGEYVKQDMEGVRDEQVALEKILGCNFKSFCQVVLLGADYTPFLKLEKADRRKVVENLLDLEIFSNMNVILKEDYAGVMDGLKDLDTQRTILREKHTTWSTALAASAEIKQTRISELEHEIGGMESEIYSFREDLKMLTFMEQDDYRQVCADITKYDTEYETWRKRNIECDQHLKRVGQEVKFFEDHKTCPTCQQNIDPEFVKKMWEDKNYHLDRYREAKIKIKGEIESVLELYQLVTTRKKNHDHAEKERARLLDTISSLESSIARAKKKIEKEQEEHEVVKQEVIDQLKIDLDLLEGNLNDGLAKKGVLVSIGKMLKDDGIKAVAIRSYIDKINLLINKCLVEMDLFVNLYLDGEFNETIKSRYRDEFKYDSFSEGQKMRIDLAILFAWREIASQRNSLSVNLLIFDEVLSGSLDSEGIVDLTKILETRLLKENIFLITHDDRITSRFANIINVTQEGNFSHMSRREADDK